MPRRGLTTRPLTIAGRRCGLPSPSPSQRRRTPAPPPRRGSTTPLLTFARGDRRSLDAAHVQGSFLMHMKGVLDNKDFEKIFETPRVLGFNYKKEKMEALDAAKKMTRKTPPSA